MPQTPHGSPPKSRRKDVAMRNLFQLNSSLISEIPASGR